MPTCTSTPVQCELNHQTHSPATTIRRIFQTLITSPPYCLLSVAAMKTSVHGGGDSASPTHTSCFCSGILRRLLICTLPTHPSDQFLDSTPELVQIQKPQEPTTHATGGVPSTTPGPGVVARLMGLETIPNHTTTTTTLGSLLRTRSVNSIDFLYHFDPNNKQGSQQHRRVRTSVSFREGGVHITPDSLLQDLLNPTTKEPQQLIVQDKNVIKKRLDQTVGGRRTCQNRTRPNVNKAKRDPVVMASKKRNTALAHNKMLQPAKSNLNKVHPQPSSPVRSRKPFLPEAGNREDRAIVKDNNEGRRMKAKERICSNPKVRETWRMVARKNVKENRVDDGVVFFRFQFLEEIYQQFAQEILHVLLRQLVDELVITSWGNGLIHAADCTS